MTDGNLSEDPQDIIDTGNVPHGENTATGLEYLNRQGKLEHHTEGTGGSELEVEGDPQPDADGATEPAGLQAEPAEWVGNGSLPPNMLPSPSGPVPASAIHHTKEAADAAVEKAYATADKEFDERFAARSEIPADTIARMSAAELRAVATDRGYKDVTSTMGRKSARSAFLKSQNDDADTSKGKK